MSRDCQQAFGRTTTSLWVAHHSDRDVWVGDGRGPTGVVDYVQDASGAGRGQEDGQQVVEASRRQSGRNLKRVCGVDIDALIEEAVAAHPVSAEAGHIVGYLEGSPAVDTWSLHPSRLARWIVGHLVLKEDGRAGVAVPDDLVLLVVLDKKPVRGHVVAVDNDAGVGGVAGPADPVAVVGPPGPNIVEDYIVAVDYQAVRRAAGRRAADTEENVRKN